MVVTNFIRQSALVLILAVVFGSGLALIYAKTNELYLANQEQATIVSISKTIPGAQQAKDLQTAEIELADGSKVYQVCDGRQTLGWAYVAKGKGFGGDIKLLIGLSATADGLVGLDVLEDVETPGFGHSINDETLFKGKFRPRNGKPIPLKKSLVVIKTQPKPDNPYQIQAITGATISSKAVVAIINDTASNVAQQLASKPSGYLRGGAQGEKD